MSQFLLSIREITRRLGRADATEQVYIGWIKRFIIYHGYQSQEVIGSTPRQAIETLLSHLANEKQLSASSINQALSALIFLYKEVLKVDLPSLSILRPPTVKALQHPLDEGEIAALFSYLEGDIIVRRWLTRKGSRRPAGQGPGFCPPEAKGGDQRLTLLPQQLESQFKTH